MAVREGGAAPRHTVHTVVGPRPVVVSPVRGSAYRIETDLGVPRLASADVPTTLEPPAPTVIDHPLDAAGRRVLVTATSMGNPHCAVFCDEPADDGLLSTLGPALEHHPFFPRRTNVEFVTALSRGEIRVRFWERGVGYTQASGTGSASAVVASIITGRTDRRVRAVCDGGTLEIEWPEGESLKQTGEAELLYDGQWTA
jgi:diaminopimelate epimerase